MKFRQGNAGSGSAEDLLATIAELRQRLARYEESEKGQLNGNREEGSLERANRELERRVCERTAELETLNELLRQEAEERRRTERVLLARKERLRLFIDHAPAALAMFDRNMRYLSVSRRWLSDYGLADRNILGQSHYDIFPEISEEWRQYHRRGMAGEVVRAEEDRFERADGSVQWLHWEIRPWRDAFGDVGGIVIFSEDITQRKDLQTELIKAKEAAEKANLAKSEFLAHMSHEIRTPVTVVHGALEHLSHLCVDPELRALITMAETASERLFSLVNESLELARIEARKIDLHSEQFDLRLWLETTMGIFGMQAEEKGIALSWSISPQLPGTLIAPAERMGQVIINLVGNALKFTEKGEVRVVVEPDPQREGAILFSVHDTGIGIPAEKLSGIFEPFNQVDPARRRRYGGTGLGLVISKELVEIMGGALRVESREGEGSTFSFSLPLGDAGTRSLR